MNLAFVWHMHQPDYRNEAGEMGMPWVFLHAIKDYYDMPWVAAQYPELKATFNITPSLIEQIGLYDDPVANDRFLRLWSFHPSALGSSDREWIVKICKSCNYDTMVRPLPRFAELYALEHYSDEAMVDLEMLFVLAWCGTYLRRNDATVIKMLEKERGFTQEDKAGLLAALQEFIATILPYYATLQQQKRITVATTPYNHPILPLLIDMNRATEANASTPLPENPVPLLDDAHLQVSRAIELYEATFGRRPTGFWPAEGAVDETSVQIYKEQGLKWICTDEALLFRSIKSSERSELFKPYRYKGVTIGFREHGLSDLIGFDYRHQSAHDAAQHFVNRLRTINGDHPDAMLFVILDGENAWEFYEANGFLFFTDLYTRLVQSTEWCRTVTMDEVNRFKSTELKQLAPGSWIRGDFTTWVGHREKNRAWELLFQARRDFESRNRIFDDATLEQIRHHFLALECSDWYWWYGDDHMTTFALEFDTLFRKHLIALYRLMQMNPPADVFEPLLEHVGTASFMVRPQSAIRPKVDGLSSSFFEWIGAGCIDESRLYSTMERTRGPVGMIRYGYDVQGNLYLSLEGEIASLRTPRHRLHIIIEERSGRITVPLERAATDDPIKVRIVKSIEMMIPRSLLGAEGKAHLRFEIEQEDQIVQTLPGFGALQVDAATDYHANWFV